VDEQDEPDRSVRGSEACRRTAGERVARVRRHHCDREDLDHGQAALNQVVALEPRGEHGTPGPGPPDQEEQRREAGQLGERVVLAQRLRDLRDGGDEHEIEEQLEPRDLALGVERGAGSRR
jgi:hypothetical protein